MYLQYMDSAPQAEAVIMCNAQDWRIELFVLRNNDDSYSLLALSGEEDKQPSRLKVQGPYQTREHAVGARSAVTMRLETTGFRVDECSGPQWRLQAQRTIKEVREVRSQNTPDCEFDPDDVY